MRRNQLLRRVATTVLVLLVLLVLSVGLLLGTSWGTRVAVGVAKRYLPETISIGVVDGTFLSGVTVEQITVSSVDTDIVVRHVKIVVAPSTLLSPADVHINLLQIGSIDVSLPDSSASDDAPNPLVLPATPVLSLPVRIRVDRVSVGPVTTSVAGNATQVLTSLDTALEADGKSIDLRALTLLTPQVAVDGALNVRLARVAGVSGTLNWRLPNVQSDDGIFKAPAGQLSLSGDRNELTLTHALREPYALDTTGTLKLPVDALPVVSLVTHGADIGAPVGDDVLTVHEFIARLDGTPEAWRLNLAGNGDFRQLQAAPFRVDAKGSMQRSVDADIAVGDMRTGTITASGAFKWDDNIAFDARATVDALRTQAFSSTEGLLNAQLAVRSDDAAAGKFSASLDSVTGNINGYAVRGNGRFESQSARDASGDLELFLGDDRLSAKLAMIDAASMNATINAVVSDLSRYGNDLSGRVTVQGRAQGEWQDPAVFVSVQGSDIAAGGQRVDALTLKVDGSLAQHTALVTTQVPVLGDVRIAATGGVQGERWQGTLDSLKIQLAAALPVANVTTFRSTQPTLLSVSSAAVSLQKLCFALLDADQLLIAESQLCAEGAMDTGAIQADLVLAGLPMNYSPSATVSLSGLANASLTVGGTITDPTATLEMSLDQAMLTEREQTQETAAAFDAFSLTANVAQRQLNVIPDIALGERLSLRGEASVLQCCGDNAALAGDVVLEAADLTVLNAFQEAVRVESGAARLSIQPSGVVSAPGGTVTANVSNGDVELIATGVRYSAVNLNASTDASGALRWTASAQPDVGTLAMTGDATLGESDGLSVNARVQMRDATLLQLPDLAARASADVNIAWTPLDTILEGNVTMTQARVALLELPEDSVSVSTDISQEGAQGQSASRMTMDLEMDLGDDTRLSGFGLDAVIVGAFALRQKPTMPLSGFGTLRTREATYKAYGQTLTVTRGRLRFSGPLDAPLLDVRAEREVDEQSVGVNISGVPGDLRSTLFASPSLADAETLSVLLTGRRLSNASAAQGDALSNAAVTLGLRQAFGVSASIRDAVGLDTLTVDGSGSGGRLLAGKQISKDLYLQYAYGVFDQISSVLLRWQLNQRLAIESQSGETQSVDLIYQVGDPSR